MPFLFMPVFTIALMGILAFSGASAPANATNMGTSTDATASNAIALAEAPTLTRATDTGPLSVKLTAYNAVPAQTDSDPSVTASGASSNPEVVAARSVDLAGTLPFGTVIALTRTADDSERCRFAQVEHLIGYRVVADSMHSRKREQIDVLLDTADTVAVHGAETNPAIALGMCDNVTIHVIGRISIKEMPKTQAELRAIVEGGKVAMR